MLAPIILALAATGVHAFPKPSAAGPPLPGYFLFFNGTRVEDYHPTRRELAPSQEVKHFGPEKRQDTGRCDIEVGDAVVVAQDLNSGPEGVPAAFGQLFDYLDAEICTSLGCSATGEYCVTASTGADICITATGSYPPDSRDQFVRSARGSFDRGVTTQRPGQGAIQTGPNLVHFQSREGPLGVGDIRIELRNQAQEGGGGCPAIISTIASGGALVPQVAAPFGTLSFLCGTAESFIGEASG